jgi:hypothetical protein
VESEKDEREEGLEEARVRVPVQPIRPTPPLGIWAGLEQREGDADA